MDATPKERAEQHRKIADAYEALADAFNVLHGVRPGTYVEAARLQREEADRIDPPQPEWQDGDYSRDRHGGLWQFVGGKWYLHGMERSTASLIRDYGPIRKVHIADPARHEVVVSLDGLDREVLLAYEDWDEGALSTLSSAGLRAAKAAHEQLGEVQ